MLFSTMGEDEFFEAYLQIFAQRFTYGSLGIESDNDVSNPDRAIEMFNNMQAFKYLIDCGKEELYIKEIQDTAYIVNKNINHFNKGFRKTQVEVNGAEWLPSKPKDIYTEVWSLLDNYYHLWNELDPYEREARFHIKLLKIHPFEDGNGRTSRLIMNYHLCLQNLAPIIINRSERKDYFYLIDNDDIDGLTSLFQKKSFQEFDVMLNLYKNIYNIEDMVEHFDKTYTLSK